MTSGRCYADTKPPRRGWHPAWYLPVLGTAMALMMLRMLVMARVMDITGFADYSAGLLTSTTFCMLGCMGLQSLLQRDMPIMIARGRARRALVLMGQAMLVACGCAAVAVAAPLLATVTGVPSWLLAIGILHGLSQQLFLVVTIESRSRGDPLQYALQNLWRALAVVASGAAIGVTTHSASWALAVEAVTSLGLASSILARILNRHALACGRLLRLMHRGWHRVRWPAAFVFLGISLVASAVFNVDRWLSAALLSQQDFAQYAFAGVVVLVAQSTQSMVSASVFPALGRRFALVGESAAYMLSARVSLGVLAVSALAALPAYLLAKMAVLRWYPAYEDALSILWLVFAVGVLRVSDFWSSFLMVCGYERRLLLLHVCVGGVVCALWTAAVLRPGAASLRPSDFAWLALLLALGIHAGTAIAATLANRYAAAALPAEALP
jgi:O-antigen/teichoic acid export membrane protein